VPQLNLSWLKEIPLHDILDEDSRVILSHCGVDILILLWENFLGWNFYFSGKGLKRAQRRYIEYYHKKYTARELARKLGCTERLVYKVLRELRDYGN